MVIECADCGCVVDRGWRLVACPDPTCCCEVLPLQTMARLAELVRAALESGDLDELYALLAPDAKWGAPEESVPTCGDRDQVIDWYRVAKNAGVRAVVTEVLVRGEHLVVGLVVEDPTGADTDHRSGQRWQVLTVRAGRIAEIRGYEDRPGAEEFVASPTSTWSSEGLS